MVQISASVISVYLQTPVCEIEIKIAWNVPKMVLHYIQMAELSITENSLTFYFLISYLKTKQIEVTVLLSFCMGVTSDLLGYEKT